MANETTSSVYSTAKLSYMLSQRALPPNAARIVATQLCNDDNIEGEPTTTRQYPVLGDLAAASAGTEGTAITTNTSLSYGSVITGTITEGALIRATVTDLAVEKRFPGMGGVMDLIQRGTPEQQMAVYMPEVNRLAGACFEKLESDVLALITSASTSVGTSGAAFTLDDAFSAIYSYDTLEGVTEENAWLFAPKQASDLARDIAITGGGAGGGVWFQQVDASFINQRNLPPNGVDQTFMGRPVYKYASSLNVLSDTNANVNGALLAIGRGTPDGGQLGAWGIVRNGGLKVRIEPSAAERGSILVVSLEYVAIEVRDAHIVRIRTDAP